MEEIASVPRRSSSLSAKGLGGWRANSNLENSDGGISDEYSDDDDPGYRIVLVEDVGELYPDVSYRLRNRIPDPVETSASNPDVSRTKDTKDNGEEDEDEDDDEDGSDEEGSGEASSDVEVDLVQRLKNLSTPNDPDTLTRLPVRVSPASHDNADRPDGSPPTSEAEVVPSEPMLAWGDTAPDKSEKGKASTAISNPSSSETKGKGGDKKGKEAKAKGDDAKKDGRAAEEGKQGKKDGAHSTAKTEEKKASVDPELDAEAGVDAETLAAHHMPDLIEGHQPMFSPPPSSASAAASTSTPISASKPKHNGTLGSEGSLQASAAAAAGSAAPAPPAPAASGDEEVPAQTAAAPAQAAAKDDTSSEKTAPEPSDETVYYDCFDLKIVYERNRTGFEETKDFPIEINGVIAGRYQILEFLGAAAFSKAVQCVDLTDGSYVCIKIIKNNKDFFDQSLDEIKILKYLNAHDTRDDHHLLQLYDYFYFKEHLFIVTELLRDNLYEFSKFNRESGAENYFTLARLQKITRVHLVMSDDRIPRLLEGAAM